MLKRRENKKTILFVCVQNTKRSQIAEDFFRKYAPDNYEALSGGIETKSIWFLCLASINYVGTATYFTFLLHTSQYLSITVTPSPTLNKASTVAKLPQLTQYFNFPL
jgi:hypothetical protein